jgi:hypothetical protein
VGAGFGSAVGAGIGSAVGAGIGSAVGAGIGSAVGAGIGSAVGAGIGLGVGTGVGVGAAVVGTVGMGVVTGTAGIAKKASIMAQSRSEAFPRAIAALDCTGVATEAVSVKLSAPLRRQVRIKGGANFAQ